MAKIRNMLILAVVAGAVVACGFRGPLEPPPNATPEDFEDRPIILDPLIGAS